MSANNMTVSHTSSSRAGSCWEQLIEVDFILFSLTIGQRLDGVGNSTKIGAI